MRTVLGLIYVVSLLPGCGMGSKDTEESGCEEGTYDEDGECVAHEEAPSSGSGSGPSGDDEEIDAEDLEHAFEVTAGVEFEHTYWFPLLGEGYYQHCNDIPEGLNIEGGGDSIFWDSIYFYGTLAAGTYDLRIGLEDYQDGPSIYRTLEVTITSVAPDEPQDDTGASGEDDGDVDGGGADDGGSDTDAPDDSSVGATCTIDTGEWTDPTSGDLGGTSGILDCGLFCIPEFVVTPGHERAWVGDGMCDEGALGTNLNCAEFDFDGGDCS